MRSIPTAAKLAAIAPFALALAACGGNTAEETAATDTAATETPVAANNGQYPEVPLDARGSVQYQGTYTQALADGRTRTLKLGTADSYVMTDADGVESTGTFNWYSDNSRLLIGSGDNKAIFAVADGMLYQLPDENAPVNSTRSADMVWTRTDGEMLTM